MRRSLLFLSVLVLWPVSGRAQVWTRMGADGVVETTNVRPTGRAKPVGAPRRSAGGSGGGGGGQGYIWAREQNGVLQFTNAPPVGANWKVWMKTGPGKASARRGTTDIVPAQDRSAERYTRYDQHIRDQHAHYGIPEALVRAVIKTESDFDPRVVSSAGARGLMQLMPDTAKDMGVEDIHDPRQNIMGGCRYLQVLVRRFCRSQSGVCTGQEIVKVLAGYHAGPGAVEKYGGLPPYATTKSYVGRVLERWRKYQTNPPGGPREVVAEN